MATFTDDARLRRKLLAYSLKKATPLPLNEVAKLAGVKSPNAVTRLVIRLERARKTDRALANMLEHLDGLLRSHQ